MDLKTAIARADKIRQWNIITDEDVEAFDAIVAAAKKELKREGVKE